MGAGLIGLALILCAILLWVGVLSLVHAVAIFIGIVGLALVLWYRYPAGYAARRRPAV